MSDPKRLQDSKDALIATLYAKRGSGDPDDAYPALVDVNGYLLVNMTVGSVSLSSTASVITNAVGNPANVSLANTKVTVESSGLGVTLSSTKVTVDNSVTLASTIVTVHLSPSASLATVSLTSTLVTAHLSPSASLATVSLTSTLVTAHLSPSASLATVSLSSTIVTVAPQTGTTLATTLRTTSLSSTAVSISTAVTYSTIMLTSKTLTTGSGSLSATNGAITITPTNRAKIYAISLTTTSASEVICVFNSGGVANGVELWRATLMAPAGANSGLNLAVSPPNFLFQSRSGTAVSLSLSSAVLVHYSVSYFDEA